MKINFYDNLLNASIIFAGCLRRRGVDAHVILPAEGTRTDDPRDRSFLPEWEDESLVTLPDWIHPLPPVHLRQLFTPASRPFLQLLGDCDLIHTFGVGPIWAARTHRPFVFLSHGGDLNVVPFLTDDLYRRVRGFLQRRALHRAALVLYGPWQQPTVDRLKLLNARPFPPWPIDAERYPPGDEAVRAAMRRRFDGDLIVFCPATHIHTHRPTHFGKGTPQMLGAFARLVHQTNRHPRLVLVEKGQVAQSRALIHELGIEPHVTWLAPMPKAQLIACYQGADIVLDQFSGIPGLGLGMIGREALACGCCLVTHFDMEVNRSYYAGNLPPLVSAATEEEIAAALLRLADDPAERQRLGQAATQWIRETHHWERAVDAYIALYESVLGP